MGNFKVAERKLRVDQTKLFYNICNSIDYKYRMQAINTKYDLRTNVNHNYFSIVICNVSYFKQFN